MAPDLLSYHWIVLSSSAGKDSQTMLDVVVKRCDAAGVPRERLVVAHAELDRVEWPGTRELAEEQARHYGLEFITVARPQGDLLAHVRSRGNFPSPTVRWCTSDHKRGPIRTVFTRLAARSRQAGVRQVRILSCLGMRAEESPARARRPAFAFDAAASNGRRHVDVWLPLHAWSVQQGLGAHPCQRRAAPPGL